MTGRRWDVSPSEWFCLLAGLFFLNQYAWFLDDAFVYFRYVDNLLFLGHGLVYNAGEYVEGFSSPFWALLLIPLRALRLDYWLLTRLIGLSSFVAFWYLAVRIRRVAVPELRPRLNLPLCLLSFNYAFACYFSSGIETPLVQLSAAIFAYFALRPSGRWIQILVGLTPLVRHEFVLPLALALAYSFWRTRRLPLFAILSCVLTLGSWLFFRIYYYAELVPNTFYLKDTTNYAQGWRYLWDTVDSYALYLILPLSWLLAWIRRDELRASMLPRAVMIVFALPVLAYVIRIGGDPRHYRYLAFPIVLFLLSTVGVGSAWLSRLSHRRRRPLALAVGALAMLLSFAAYPRQLSGHPIRGKVGHQARWEINDAVVHRYHESLRRDPWSLHSEDQLDRYREYRSVERNRAYPIRPVVGWWCSSIYAQFDRRVIHGLGLTDAILARVNMPADRPAHKMGLIPLATDLAGLLGRSSAPPRRGFYEAAVAQGVAPVWIAENLESVRLIESKIYNEHSIAENLRLALTRVPRLDVDSAQSAGSNQSSQ